MPKTNYLKELEILIVQSNVYLSDNPQDALVKELITFVSLFRDRIKKGIEWQEKNKDKIRIISRKSYEKNKDKAMARAKIWHQNNPEKVRETVRKYRKRYYEENKEKLLEKERKNRAKQKEKHKLMDQI